MLDELFKGFTVIDFECTSLDSTKSEIIEIGVSWYEDDDWKYTGELRKPNEPISALISSKTFISNRMVEGKELFGTEPLKEHGLMRIGETSYFIAHNAQFDHALIASASKDFDSGLFLPIQTKPNWICTYRLVQKLFADQIEKFNLSYMRYWLDLDVPDDLPAHRAGPDAFITGKLFENCIMVMLERGLLDLEQELGPQIIEYYNTFEAYPTWPFGKYKGQSFSDVPEDYYVWAIDNMDALNETSFKYDPRLAFTIQKLFE